MKPRRYRRQKLRKRQKTILAENYAALLAKIIAQSNHTNEPAHALYVAPL